MSLEALFKAAVRELRQRKTLFAVAGGFAADLYRAEPRLTRDVDLAVLTETEALKTAVSVIESLGLEARIVRAADLAGGPPFAIKSKRTAVCMVVGRPTRDPSGPGVDILLPSIPWAADAVRRAQANEVDFGFGMVPTLTLEDIIVAKLYALRTRPVRAKDLDDLQSIFAAAPAADRPYLAGQVRRFQITIPREAKPFLPDWLVAMARA